ncbi:MAG: hypothetical protein WDZ70_00485 [Candidatus Paceibacterota bacterium]
MNSPVQTSVAEIVPVEVVISVSRGYFKEEHTIPEMGMYTVHVDDCEVVVEYPETHDELATVARTLIDYLRCGGFTVMSRKISSESQELGVYIHSWLYTQLYEERLRELTDALRAYVKDSPRITLLGV